MADIFISYAREDLAWVEKLNRALEAQGYSVWWDRNLATGARYLKETESQLREARATIVVWSKVSIDSHWVADEAALARDLGRLVPISKDSTMPPLGFGQYQATDFSHWNGGAGEPLSVLLKALAERTQRTERAVASKRPVAGLDGRVLVAIAAAAGLLLLLMAAGAWWWLRPPPAAAHSMLVRLAGFQLLSPDLPATIGDTVNAEITPAFNADGVVGVSTASAPAPGAAPAYALGGTIRRDGQTIRVITHLTNERSGATIWSDNFNYDVNELSRVPRHIAVDAGNVVRCGLFGASTYRETLPDAVLRDYMQFCQGHWDPNLMEGRKALIPAQRVVAAVPEFSWGWAAVAGAYWKVALTADNNQIADEARASGRQAADRAIAIDGQNSEALYIKSMLVEPHDWLGRESLLKRAVAARRLDCGCEYHQYGWMLTDVGRIAEAVERLRQANDMLALYVYTPLTLADALVAAGNAEEAKSYYNAAIDLAPDSGFAKRIMVTKATRTGDAEALRDPDLPIAAELRAALQKAYGAVASGDAGAKAEAVQALLALPEGQQGDTVARLLANLGAAHEAFQVATRLATTKYHGPALFWYRDMRATLSDPGFPAVAVQLGLMNYWKTSHTRPDVCTEKNAPPFCRMI
jgi:tetratricopeptide (TPR) repeat protein